MKEEDRTVAGKKADEKRNERGNIEGEGPKEGGTEEKKIRTEKYEEERTGKKGSVEEKTEGEWMGGEEISGEKGTEPAERESEIDRWRAAPWRTGLMLFVFFFQIGFFTFGGGWSILAQIDREFVEKRHLITKDNLLDLAAVGKSIPGVMITNISLLFGYEVGGWFGGICAVLGISCPAILILSLVTLGYNQVKDNYWFGCVMKGIRCSVVPIIASAAISLGKDIFRTIPGRVITAVAFFLCFFTQIGNITLVAGAVLGALIWRGVKKHGIS
ncbi:chromate transporter [Lachnospiraceae bacterium 62-35]